MKLYVSNLPYEITRRQFYNLFAQFGEAQSYKLVMDRNTNRALGYAFVEMEDDNALRAISMLSEETIGNRKIFVTKRAR